MKKDHVEISATVEETTLDISSSVEMLPPMKKRRGHTFAEQMIVEPISATCVKNLFVFAAHGNRLAAPAWMIAEE